MSYMEAVLAIVAIVAIARVCDGDDDNSLLMSNVLNIRLNIGLKYCTRIYYSNYIIYYIYIFKYTYINLYYYIDCIRMCT